MSGASEGLAKVMKALNYIPKQTSQGVSYKFRSVDAVFNEIHEKLADADLVLVPRVLDDWQLNMIPGTNNRTQTQALFRLEVSALAADGSSEVIGVGLAQSHDYGDKAVYQAQQNAIKYVLIEAFAIPTADRDMDEREASEIPAVQAVTPKQWVWDASAVFKAWSEDERKAAAKLAMEQLAFDELVNMDEAKAVLDHMRGQYETSGAGDVAGMTLTHNRCGGTLEAEEHRRWSLNGPGEQWRRNDPILLDLTETLHRCDRCRLVGVAAERSKQEPRPMSRSGVLEMVGRRPYHANCAIGDSHCRRFNYSLVNHSRGALDARRLTQASRSGSQGRTPTTGRTETQGHTQAETTRTRPIALGSRRGSDQNATAGHRETRRRTRPERPNEGMGRNGCPLDSGTGSRPCRSWGGTFRRGGASVSRAARS